MKTFVKSIIIGLTVIVSCNLILAQETPSKIEIGEVTLNDFWYSTLSDSLSSSSAQNPILENGSMMNRVGETNNLTNIDFNNDPNAVAPAPMLQESGSEEISGGPIASPAVPTILPSPTAQSLIPDLNDNVNLYTGRVQLEYPIFNFKSHDIEVPITLNYSSNGVKLNSIASWVGMDWSLNAGGLITRVMHSLPDEYNGEVETPYSQQTFLPAKGFLQIPNYATESYYFGLPNEDERKKLIEYSNKSWDYSTLGGDPMVYDTEQDEFYFNFGNYSGKFVFNNSGGGDIIPAQNLKITKVITAKGKIDDITPHITGFTIVTPDGVEYIFGNDNVLSEDDLTSVEITNYATKSSFCRFGYLNYGSLLTSQGEVWLWDIFPQFIFEGGEPSFRESLITDYLKLTSTWYLREIKDPKGNKVNFNYNKFPNDKVNISSITQSVSQLNIGRYGEGWCSPNCETGVNTGLRGGSALRHMPQNVTFTLNACRYTNIVLSEIYDNTGNKVEFFTEPRADLVNGRALKQINIYNKNKVLKSCQFNYEYMGSPIEYYNAYLWFKRNQEDLWYVLDLLPEVWRPLLVADHNRLFLKAIIMKSEEERSLTTSFKYNVTKIPCRFSQKHDKWGYYNSNIVGNFLPERGYSNWQGRGDTLEISYEFGKVQNKYNLPNMTVDENKTKAGILEEVYYPTGAIKKFFYSQNESKNNGLTGGVRLIRTETKYNGEILNNVSYTYSDGYMLNSPFWKYTNNEHIDTYNQILMNVNTYSSPLNGICETHGNSVGYGIAKKIYNNNSYEEYHFSTPASVPNEPAKCYDTENNFYSYTRKWAPMTDFDYKRGIVQDVFYKDKDHNTLKHINYEYYTDFGPTKNISSSLIPIKLSNNLGSNYYAAFFNYKSQYIQLKKETIKEYTSDLSNYLLNETLYEYNNYGQINKLSIKDSKGDEIKKIYKYPVDYNFFTPNTECLSIYNQCMINSGGISSICEEEFQICLENYSTPEFSDAITEMRKRNMFSSLVEQQTIKSIGGEDYLLNSKLTKYKLSPESYVLPCQEEAISTNIPILYTDFKTSTIKDDGEFIYDNRYKEELYYDAFNENGNLKQFHKRDDNPVSYVWGYNGQYPVAQVTNAEQNKIYYTSFETPDVESTTYVSNYKHLGSQSCKLNSNEWINFTFLKVPKNKAKGTYKTSVWMYTPNYNGTDAVANFGCHIKDKNGNNLKTETYFQSKSYDGWKRIEYTFTIDDALIGQNPTDEFILNPIMYTRQICDVYIDDFRMHPIDAQMTSYTYEPLVGMTSATGPDNKSQTYEYDEFNRLKLIKDQNGNIVERYTYNYYNPLAISGELSVSSVYNVVNDGLVEPYPDEGEGSLPPNPNRDPFLDYEVVRTLTGAISIKNTDITERYCSLTFEVMGSSEKKTVSKTIPPNATETFTASWDFESGPGQSKTVTVTGDISTSGHGSLLATVPEYTITNKIANSTVTPTGRQVTIDLDVENTGLDKGTCTINFTLNGVTVSRSVNLIPGEISPINKIINLPEGDGGAREIQMTGSVTGTIAFNLEPTPAKFVLETFNVVRSGIDNYRADVQVRNAGYTNANVRYDIMLYNGNNHVITEVLNESLAAGQAKEFSKTFVNLNTGSYRIDVVDMGQLLSSREFQHVGTPVFSLYDNLVVDNSLANGRTVIASVRIQNTGTGEGPCTLNFAMDGFATNPVSHTISHTGENYELYTTSWQIGEGFAIDKTITVTGTGGVSTSKTFTVPSSPAKFVFQSINVISTGGDNYRADVGIRNDGYSDDNVRYTLTLYKWNDPIGGLPVQGDIPLSDYNTYYTNITTEFLNEPLDAKTSNVFSKAFSNLGKGFYRIVVMDIDQIVGYSELHHNGTPLFSLYNNLSANPTVTLNNRTVTASVRIKNTGTGEGPCTLNFELPGFATNPVTHTIHLTGTNNELFETSWDIGKGIAKDNLVVKVTGPNGIVDTKSINIAASPANMLFSSVNATVTNPSQGDIQVRVVYNNTGYTNGTVNTRLTIYKFTGGPASLPPADSDYSQNWVIDYDDFPVISANATLAGEITRALTVQNGQYRVVVREGENIKGHYDFSITSVIPPPSPTLMAGLITDQFGGMQVVVTLLNANCNGVKVTLYFTTPGSAGQSINPNNGITLTSSNCQATFAVTTGPLNAIVRAKAEGGSVGVIYSSTIPLPGSGGGSPFQ